MPTHPVFRWKLSAGVLFILLLGAIFLYGVREQHRPDGMQPLSELAD